MDWLLWAYRQLYWCKRTIVKKCCPREEPYEKVSVHIDSLPWLWIGNTHPDQPVVTVTEIINKSIQYGVRVTPEYLSKVAGFYGGNWYYIDAKTLEERLFPSEGFVIEDVLDKSLSDSE